MLLHVLINSSHSYVFENRFVVVPITSHLPEFHGNLSLQAFVPPEIYDRVRFAALQVLVKKWSMQSAHFLNLLHQLI